MSTTKTVKPDELTPREGKVLRYVLTYTPGTYERKPNVQPYMCAVTTEWSDLPQSLLQAKRTLEKLRKLALVKKVGDGYVGTKAGQRLIDKANERDLWNTSTTKPPRRV